MKKYILLIAWLSLSGILRASSDFSNIFNKFEMKFDDLLEDIFFEDLNNDQLKDILILTKGENNEKKLHLFFQNRNGFNSVPSQILDFDGNAVVFDIGNVTNRYPGKEIVYLTPADLKYYHFEGAFYHSEPAQLTDVSSIFQSPSVESPVRSKFIWDLNGEGLDDLLVPVPEYLLLLSSDQDGKYKISQKIHLGPIFVTQSRLRASADIKLFENFSQKLTIYVPLITIEDFNGDQRKDILSLFREQLKVFFQNERKEFSEEPDFAIDLGILTEEEKQNPSPPFYKVFATDVDSDGLIDILVFKSQIKTTASLSKIYSYLNKKGKIDSAPDQVWLNENSFGTPEILDVDGDQHKDLVMPEMEMGIFPIFKMLLTKKLTYEDAIYLGQKGPYPTVPAARVKSNVIVDFNNLGIKPEGDIAYFSGDFNRDGIKDILRRVDEKNELVIYLGTLEKRKINFAESPSYLFRGELSSGIIVEDLNHDRLSDIIFDYRREKKRMLVLFLSK